jgi:hypothetical protein
MFLFCGKAGPLGNNRLDESIPNSAGAFTCGDIWGRWGFEIEGSKDVFQGHRKFPTIAPSGLRDGGRISSLAGNNFRGRASISGIAGWCSESDDGPRIGFQHGAGVGFFTENGRHLRVFRIGNEYPYQSRVRKSPWAALPNRFVTTLGAL